MIRRIFQHNLCDIFLYVIRRPCQTFPNFEPLNQPHEPLKKETLKRASFLGTLHPIFPPAPASTIHLRQAGSDLLSPAKEVFDPPANAFRPAFPPPGTDCPPPSSAQQVNGLPWIPSLVSAVWSNSAGSFLPVAVPQGSTPFVPPSL